MKQVLRTKKEGRGEGGDDIYPSTDGACQTFEREFEDAGEVCAKFGHVQIRRFVSELWSGEYKFSTKSTSSFFLNITVADQDNKRDIV